MFPCCCLSPRGTIYLQSSNVSDPTEVEWQELSLVTSEGVESPPSPESEGDSDIEVVPLTEEAIAHTEVAYQGILYAEESMGLISMAYTLLRACNYVQLCAMEYLARETRGITSTPSPASVNQTYNLLLAELWVVHLIPEAGVIVMSNTHNMRRHVACSLYIRAINIVHSMIDLALNSAILMSSTQQNGQGEQGVRGLLILADLLNLTNETIYFCTPVIQQIQERLSLGRAATYFNRLCVPLRGVGRIVHGALGRLAVITGTIGVACTAGLSATLTAQSISAGQDSSQQRAVLGVQLTITAIATAALAWMTRANRRRARQELGEENV